MREYIAIPLTLAVAAILLSSCGGGGGDGNGPSPKNPSPAIEVAPKSLDFGTPLLGATVSRTLVISNTGTAPLAVSAVELDPAASAEFTVVAPSPSALAAIAPGASLTVEVRYTPAAVAARTWVLVVRSNDPVRPAMSVAVVGNGGALPAPAIEIAPSSLDFGSPRVGVTVSRTLVIGNAGTAPLAVSALELDPAASAEFTVVPPPAGALADIAPGGSVAVEVLFTPAAVAATTGVLVVRSNDAVRPAANVTVFGTGMPLDCTPALGPDLPDDAFADTNCDGIDGDVTRAVFVAPPPFGDDAAAGTRAAPVATLARAGQLAAATNRDLYLAEGVFTEPTTFLAPQGSSVYGGFATSGPLGPFSGPRTGASTIAGASTAVRVAASLEVVLDRLTVIAADAAAPAPFATTSIAVLVEDSTLTLRRVDLLAGRGRDGQPGSTPPGTAAAGAQGVTSTSVTGGLGGQSVSVGGRGGNGGIGFQAGATGAPGSGGASGGTGGDASCGGVAGLDGTSGGAGAPGADGRGQATGIGDFAAGRWSAGFASAGQAGAIGASGGGGGGSGGVGTTVQGCSGSIPLNGGGGGGGGGGGAGGAAGGGGQQGGASFAVVAAGSTVTVRDSTIRVSPGGAGALGGIGQLGGAGAPGGGGAQAQSGARGGSGGRGGDGGRGGNGGCGAGGPSVALVAVPGTGASFVREGTVNVVLPATPAPGGTGACIAGGPGLVQEAFP